MDIAIIDSGSGYGELVEWLFINDRVALLSAVYKRSIVLR